MDIEQLRKIKLREIEETARQRAVDEIIALKKRHIGNDLRYTFECDGKQITAAFVTASLQEDPLNAFQIELLAPAGISANGQAYIYDISGKKLGATASTRPQGNENRIILETLAVK